MKQKERIEVKRNVPRLRFPEFKNAGDWDEQPFSKIAEIINERVGNRKFLLMSITAGVGLESQNKKFGREIAGNSYKNYFVIRKGDFAYNKSSTKIFPEGQISLLDNEDEAAVPSSIFICFNINKKISNVYFLKNLFDKNIHGIWLRKFISVGARAHGSLNVDSKDIISLPISLPSLPEQQKIADCLSSVDELISIQAQKLDALKSHKKGLLQELFPAEGETVPRLRFPKFRGVGEWKQRELGEIAEPVLEKVNTADEYLNILSLTAENGIVLQSDYFGKKIAGNDISRYIKIEKNDFVYNDRVTKFYPLGTLKRLAKFENGIVSPIYKCFRFNCDQNPLYWDFFFESGNHEREIKKIINEGARVGRYNISISNFLNIRIEFPSLPEQQKIADCLSSIDELISIQAQKLDVLKSHKKGLLQQLFPEMRES